MIETATAADVRRMRFHALTHDAAAERAAWRTLRRAAFDPTFGRFVEGVASDGRPNAQGCIDRQAGAVFPVPMLLLWAHDIRWPCGVVHDVRYEPEYGPGGQHHFTAELATRLPWSSAIWRAVRDGTLAHCSVRMDWTRSEPEFEHWSEVRFLQATPIEVREWRVNEISLVQQSACAGTYILRQYERPRETSGASECHNRKGGF